MIFVCKGINCLITLDDRRGLLLSVCVPSFIVPSLFKTLWRGHGGRVVTLSPPTSAAGVRSPSWP